MSAGERISAGLLVVAFAYVYYLSPIATVVFAAVVLLSPLWKGVTGVVQPAPHRYTTIDLCDDESSLRGAVTTSESSNRRDLADAARTSRAFALKEDLEADRMKRVEAKVLSMAPDVAHRLRAVRFLLLETDARVASARRVEAVVLPALRLNQPSVFGPDVFGVRFVYESRRMYPFRPHVEMVGFPPAVRCLGLEIEAGAEMGW